MAFDFKSAELQVGKTIPVVLSKLPGQPVVHLEYLGDTNATYVSDLIGKANAKKSTSGGRKMMSKKELAKALTDARELLAKHAVRNLECKHVDGTEATNADIPLFCESIPAWQVWELRDMASTLDNYLDFPIEGDPKDLAEK